MISESKFYGCGHEKIPSSSIYSKGSQR
uniref:Uncharacterized protein n=1 Tax=Anguilla anguilla TaxID=7936 RepID=A0A0E9UV71_ANGAN